MRLWNLRLVDAVAVHLSMNLTSYLSDCPLTILSTPDLARLCVSSLIIIRYDFPPGNKIPPPIIIFLFSRLIVRLTLSTLILPPPTSYNLRGISRYT